jgi:hypothetical protein
MSSAAGLVSGGGKNGVWYELGWTTEPGLKGLSVSGFRAAATATPDNEHGVAVEFASEGERDGFLREIEAHFAARRFTNTAAAFDTVKAYVVEWTKPTL